MKKLFILLVVAFGLSPLTHAQTSAFNTLDANKVKARVMVAGDMFWDPGVGLAQYEFPAGGGQHSAFASSLWVGGFDRSTAELKVAAQTYRQSGMDYWAGPLDTAGSITTQTAQDWDQIWKVSQDDIDSFFNIPVKTVNNVPTSILEWPGRGNIYSKTSTNTSLTIPNKSMAPFVDLNNDNLYDPLGGDYPKMRGEQMLWWVFNDVRPHTETMSTPLGLEVHASAWACSNTAVENMTFYDYNIYYLGTSILDSAVIGIWHDIDIGNSFDDFIGFDSTYRMGIGYNGDNFDDMPGYGANLTQTGCVILETPNDDLVGLGDPIGHFTSYQNNFAYNGNPEFKEHFYGYMTGSYKDSTPILVCGNPGKYQFPDDPSIVGGCSEVQEGSIPYDRRFIISTSDFSMVPGATPYHFRFAMINTELGTSNANFNALRMLADTAFNYIDGCNPSNNFPASTNDFVLNDLSLYPNPVTATLNINDSQRRPKQISLLSTAGQVLERLQNSNMINTIDVSSYATGVYFVQIISGNKQMIEKILVQ